MQLLDSRWTLATDHANERREQHWFTKERDVAAAAFAVGYSCPGGYASGVLVGSYQLSAGRFFINTLRVLDNIDLHPAADRLLLNLIAAASEVKSNTNVDLPHEFDRYLARIGYL